MIIRSLEIGVAVNDLEKISQKIAFVFEADKGKSIAASEYNMTAQMIRIGNIEFELMEPLNQKGLIEKFIQQRGQGLHHIAFQVDDIIHTIDEMKQRGVVMLNEEPIQTHGMKAAFLHPDSFCGVLIELIEGSPRWVNASPLPLELQSPASSRGVGAEGLLSIGIMVEDVASAAEIYSNALGTSQSNTYTSDECLTESCTFRVGNVDLKLIQIPKKGAETNLFFKQNRPGLNHLVIKVENLRRSLEFLKKHGIGFECDHIFSAAPIPVIALNPEEFGGIPILLKDSIMN
ncbi:MAG: VOC family protein [Proteobacteria bacterium]|nr:VOC family protein [Pseudomonadota bacterium]MBU1695559.1 VOC family protein [Pseudomonadota bacterium]